MEITTEATIEGEVRCPFCGAKFEAVLTGEVTVTLDPEDYIDESRD